MLENALECWRGGRGGGLGKRTLHVWQSDRNCLIHASLDFARELQKYIYFLSYTWWTSEECKTLDACPTNCIQSTPIPLLIRWKNIKNQICLWFCIVWTVFNATSTFSRQHLSAFSLLYVLFRKNHKINAVCFPSFYNDC